MKLLLDENIPRPTAEELRQFGHDVREVCGSELAGASDQTLWALAQREQRILVTTDRDFAAYRDSAHHGILLIRLRQPSRAGIHDRILNAVRANSNWKGLFVSVRDRAQVLYRYPKSES